MQPIMPLFDRDVNTLFSAALRYAELGYAVFPVHRITGGQCSCGRECDSPGKHPMTEHGVRDATTDPKTIMKWFVNLKDGDPMGRANVGRAVYETEIVLDIDPRHGGFEALDKYSIAWPESAPLALTGSGGLHVSFSLPADVSVKGRPLKVDGKAIGVDVRARGNYVVAPPSNHLEGVYAWRTPLVPPAELPLCPDNILALIREKPSPRATGASGNGWADLLRGVPEGQRNDAAARLAGYLLAKGLPEEVATEIMLAWNLRNSPPESEWKIRETVRNIARAEGGLLEVVEWLW